MSSPWPSPSPPKRREPRHEVRTPHPSTERPPSVYVKALCAWAEGTEPTEAELGAGEEDHRKFYFGQTDNLSLAVKNRRCALIYTDTENLDEEADAAYTELLDALEYKARELFGSEANLTVRSPIGLFLRIFAWILNMLFSTIEDVYNSRFVDTAVGTSLYNLGKAIGLKLLSEQKSSGYLQITGTPGTIVPVGWLAGTVAGLQFVVMAQGEIGTGGTVLLPAQATTAGPEGNVAAGTVTVVINPGIPEGITAVTNPAAFDGGRARETDEEYRDRYYQSVDYAGGVNADAIRGEILQNVEGVYSAIVYENDTDETDSEGLPPHSIEAVVYGGLDSDVAQQIFRRKAAGIQTYGSTTVAVLSSSGVTYNIKFSRPTLVPVWIKVTDLETDANRFPVDGKDQIAQALIDYIGSDVKGGTTIGETVYYNRLPEVIYTIPGVLDFTLQTSPDGSDYGTYNIEVDTREKAYTEKAKVSVT